MQQTRALRVDVLSYDQELCVLAKQAVVVAKTS